MALPPEMLDELTRGCKTPEDVSKLYSQMLQHMINRSLEAEMDAHLGYDRHEKAEPGGKRGNTRNGKSRKTVQSDVGELTGGVVRLGRITKQGNKYLRTLLIHGTRAVLATLGEKSDKLSTWVRQLIERRGYKRATVALAAKNARIVWALLTQHSEYQRIAAQ